MLRTSFFALALLAATTTARTADAREKPMPWDRLPSNTLDALTGGNMLVFGAAILSTGALAASGVDDRVHSFYLHNDIAARWVHRSFFVAGNFVPLVVPAGVWIAGLLADDAKLAGSGAGALQALGVSFVLVHALKFATGRPLPMRENGERDATAFLIRSDSALEWGTYGGGVAWPSGHTSAMFSIVAAAHAYYPEHLWVPMAGYPLAAAMGYMMVEGHYHWVSDTVAGALIGGTIGYSIGRAFRMRVDGKEDKTALHLVPMLRGSVGATLVGAF